MSIYGTPHLRYLFNQFNKDYFGDCLPVPNFEVIHSFKYLGYFHTEIWDGTTINPIIQISDNYEYTDHQIRDVFVHEMIHYYLAYTGIDIQCTHGVEFLKKANELNRKYGLNITELIDISHYKRRKGTSWFKYILAKIF